MGDNMTYKDVVSSQWALGKTASTLSGSSQLSDTKRNWTPFGLHIIPKEVEESDQPILQATTEELFCYFRVYISTIAKTQIFSMLEETINGFFWYHIQNLIFYSLPHAYVQVFIAAYAPEDHFYLDKMNPLLFGYNFIVIFCAFFELMRFLPSNMFLMDYIWLGLTQKNPWNTCSDTYRTPTKMLQTTYTVECYDIVNFTKIIKEGLAVNKTIHFHKFEYYLKDNAGNIECFRVPHLFHFITRWQTRKKPMQETEFALYFLIIWGLAALHYNQFFKKYIWKMLKFSHYTDICIKLLTTAYIFLSYNVFQPELKKVDVILVDKKGVEDMDLDIGLITIALNAPPVIHVLISRSTTDHNKIQCKSVSALLVGTSWLFIFFDGIMTKYLQAYCEKLVGVQLHQSRGNLYGFYFINSIYYSYFLLGNIYFIITVVTKFLSAFYLFVITYQCLVEAIVCEWKYVTRIMLISFLTLMALLTNLLLQDKETTMVYIYGKAIAILLDMIGIYILYPLGRLIEDIIFQSGNEPHILQKWCLRFVPIYVGYKIFKIMVTLKRGYSENLTWCWFIPIVLLIAGIIYAMFIILFLQRRHWHSLFCPIPEWGPPDYKKRRCRKMYRKHEYIGSQAERELSRYMLTRDEIEVVKLDIKYDVGRRSTKTQYYNTESDKKTL